MALDFAPSPLTAEARQLPAIDRGQPSDSQGLVARAWLRRIAVRSLNRIVIVPVAQIIRLEADDNYVRIWADRMYLHKETLTRLVANLDPTRFQRVHRSHVVNLEGVRELRPLLHGEYRIVMIDGAEITSGRSYTRAIRQAFELD